MNIHMKSKSVNKPPELKYVSPDEPMLKELERRDGIYSFIFHELEARKPEICPASLLAVSAATTTNTITTTNASNCSAKSVRTLPLLSTSLPTQPSKSTTQMRNGSSANFKKPSTKLLPFKTAFPGCALKSNPIPEVTTASCTSSSNSVSTSRPAKERDYHSLYAYLPKCRVCVRTPSPGFSHQTIPLVRNRRHVLKETPEYKQSFSFRNSKFPDLRDLFPHDPDVFTPFLCTPKTEADFHSVN